MAQEIVGVKIQVEGNAGEAVGSLRKQLKEAQAEVQALSDKFGATSKQAVEAAKKAADLKDRIGDAKALTDAFNPDRKFQAFGSALQAVAGGFSAVQGALGLLGVNSNAVEKTLLKVQSAMALSQGLNSLMEAKDAFKNLGAVAVNVFKAIKTAIGSTGIGLLVIALGSIVAYWDDIKAAVTGVSSELENSYEVAKKNSKIAKDQLETSRLQENSLRLQGKSEREIINIRIEKQKQQIKAAKAELEQQKLLAKAQIEAEARNQEFVNGMLQGFRKSLQLLFDGINAIGDVLGQDWNLDSSEYLTDTIFDADAVKEQTDQATAELQKGIEQLESDLAGSQLAIQGIEKEATNKQKEILSQRKKNQNDFYFEQKELTKKYVQDNLQEISNITDKINKHTEDSTQKLNERIKNVITQSLTDRINLTNELLVSQQDRELAAIELEYQRKFELIKGNEAAELALREETEKQKTEIKLKYENQRLDIAKQALSNIANVVGKETAAGKAIAIASATIDTYQAANKALKADYGVFGPAAQVARFIAVASTIAVGIKNIKEIAKAKVPGGGASASVPAGLSSMAAPIAPSAPIQNTLTQLDQRSINQLGSATNRAYVVESDITNSQERIRRINRAARLN